jgi:hypothetical protein
VTLDGHVGLDGSSSGSGSTVNGSHVGSDRFLVVHIGNSGSLGSTGGLKTSKLTSLNGSSVSLGPLDVVLTSGSSFGRSAVLIFPRGGEFGFALSKFSGGSGHFGITSLEVGLCCSSSLDGIGVFGTSDFPLGEGSSALLLHGELMSKSFDVERFGKFGSRSSCFGFGVPHFSEFQGRGCDVSCVEVAADLDGAVTAEFHGLSDVLHANAFSISHGARSSEE